MRTGTNKVPATVREERANVSKGGGREGMHVVNKAVDGDVNFLVNGVREANSDSPHFEATQRTQMHDDPHTC